jgi:hypothetical protein
MDSKPLKVELVRGASAARVGRTSFYRVAELVQAPFEPVPARGTGHSGEFRDHTVLTQLCSIAPDQVEGAVCVHEGGLRDYSHWSCCGLRFQEACTRTAPSVCTFVTSGRTYIAQVKPFFQ